MLAFSTAPYGVLDFRIRRVCHLWSEIHDTDSTWPRAANRQMPDPGWPLLNGPLNVLCPRVTQRRGGIDRVGLVLVAV